MARGIGPLVQASSWSEQLARTLLLLVIFGLTVGAFWFNYEHRLKELQASSSVRDPAGMLTADDRATLLRLVDKYDTNYGVRLVVLVSPDGITLPSLDGKTLFVGVAPAKGTATVVFPPLLRKALGEQYRIILEEELLGRRLLSGDPPGRVLTEGLNSLLARLGEAS